MLPGSTPRRWRGAFSNQRCCSSGAGGREQTMPGFGQAPTKQPTQTHRDRLAEQTRAPAAPQPAEGCSERRSETEIQPSAWVLPNPRSASPWKGCSIRAKGEQPEPGLRGLRKDTALTTAARAPPARRGSSAASHAEWPAPATVASAAIPVPRAHAEEQSISSQMNLNSLGSLEPPSTTFFKNPAYAPAKCLALGAATSRKAWHARTSRIEKGRDRRGYARRVLKALVRRWEERDTRPCLLRIDSRAGSGRHRRSSRPWLRLREKGLSLGMGRLRQYFRLGGNLLALAAEKIRGPKSGPTLANHRRRRIGPVVILRAGTQPRVCWKSGRDSFEKPSEAGLLQRTFFAETRAPSPRRQRQLPQAVASTQLRASSWPPVATGRASARRRYEASPRM